MRTTFSDLTFFCHERSETLCVENKKFKYQWKGINNLNYVTIGDQIKFIDTTKFYQEPLPRILKNTENNEKENIKKSLIVFLETHPRYSVKYNLLTFPNKMWIINYLSSEKGVIPYESIKTWEDLNKVPDNNFFRKAEFFSTLKNTTISHEEYEDVKKLFNLLRMQTLSDVNALYNFQDTIILCEICEILFENRAKNMQQKFKFNPRKCSSASTLGGAIHRDMFKVIISFPNKVEIVELMEKTLIGGINVVNTRIGFDTDLFTKNTNQKLVYKIRNKNNQVEDKRIAAKILKLDENNQYGNAMTKPLPTGCIKKREQCPRL